MAPDVTFEGFEAEAHRMWGEIPAHFKEGIDGLVVSREVHTHAEHDDFYTLGMCYTEPYPSDYRGPETTRSFLALYHGSFKEVAKDDPDFDWEGELWETITHELRHHLEHLADDDELVGVDYAGEESYRRDQGLDFDPWFYQSGTLVAPNTYRVEKDVYLEWPWSRDIPEGEPIEFEWSGKRWRVPSPGELEDVHFVWMNELAEPGGSFQLVLLRRAGWWERLRRLWTRETASLGETEGHPKAVDPSTAEGS